MTPTWLGTSNGKRWHCIRKFVGPCCRLSGQHSRLLLLQSKFKSFKSFDSVSFWKRIKLNVKRGRGWTIEDKNDLREIFNLKILLDKQNNVAAIFNKFPIWYLWHFYRDICLLQRTTWSLWVHSQSSACLGAISSRKRYKNFIV